MNRHKRELTGVTQHYQLLHSWEPSSVSQRQTERPATTQGQTSHVASPARQLRLPHHPGQSISPSCRSSGSPACQTASTISSSACSVPRVEKSRRWTSSSWVCYRAGASPSRLGSVLLCRQSSSVMSRTVFTREESQPEYGIDKENGVTDPDSRILPPFPSR